MISSKDNPQLKLLKRMMQQPKRADERMVVEGIHATQLLLAQIASLEASQVRLWVAERAHSNAEIAAIVVQARALAVKVMTVSDALFRDLSGLEQGVSVLVELPRPRLHKLPVQKMAGNVVLLDAVQDPGNMGSIIRSCAAAGVTEIWLNADCANPYAPKVLRAGVGAHFSVVIREGVDLTAAMAQLQKWQIQICATRAYVDETIYTHDLRRPTGWLLGNEGAGVAPHLLEKADHVLSIPMHAGESLNVAAAAAVCLFEMQRQQRTAS